MKPLLKWAGGKARLVPLIESAFRGPCKGRYLEPFIGSGAVFLGRRANGNVPGDAILSDVNPKLVALHVAVRDDVDGVLDELSRMPVADGWQDAYYAVRDAFNVGPHMGPKHAARFLWLNRAGFNGLYRENRDGAFNVPVGRYTEVRMPDEVEFREVSRLLQGADIRVGSFEEIMRLARRGDQVYCDPPYVPLSQEAALSQTASFTAYARSPFGMREQKQLAIEAEGAAGKGAHVVLSNHDLPVVRRELYKESSGFAVVASPPVTRAISRSAAGRKSVQEVIASIGPFRHVA